MSSKKPPIGKSHGLFGVEIWLKAIAEFFDTENIPMSSEQRSQIALRNYSAELDAVRSALDHVGTIASTILGDDRRDLAPFLLYVGQQQSFSAGREGASTEREMAFAIEKIQDMARVVEGVAATSFLSLQTFKSCGRVVVSLLADDPAVGLFLTERLRPHLDPKSKKTLGSIVERIAGTPYRKEIVGLLMELFKLIRTLEMAHPDLDHPDLASRTVLLFGWLHAETRRMDQTIQRRFLPVLSEESAFAQSLDRLVFSSEMELRKVHEIILVDVLHLTDSRNRVGRLEDAHGILLNLFQQNVVQIVETFTDRVDARSIFPAHVTRQEQSLELRTGLWSLIQRTSRLQEREDRASLSQLHEGLDEFSRTTMRHLMFKDWAIFERHSRDLRRENSMKGLVRLSHQLEVYLRTLIREISKRTALAGLPFRPDEDPDAESGSTVRIRRPKK